jgi:hypothetical protein
MHSGIAGLLIYITLLLVIGFTLIKQLVKEIDSLAVLALIMYLVYLIDTIGLVPSSYSHFQWLAWGLIGLSIRVRTNKAELYSFIKGK